LDWNAIAPALLAAIPGLLAGLGALWQTKRSAKRADKEVELLATKGDIDGLRVLVESLQHDNESLRGERQNLKNELTSLTAALDDERQKRSVLSQRVQELIEENQKLHIYIGELNERVRFFPSRESLEVMKGVPLKVARLYELACSLDLPEEFMHDLKDLITVVDNISIVVRGT
jgi:regulator of replication initiation timing